jgi:zeaxanthin glucosyltransferase
MRRHHKVIANWAKRFVIGPRRTLLDCLSRELQIAQVPRGFDFPRPEPLPFESVGPIRRLGTAELSADLPFKPDGRRPLVFATMGTLQGGRVHVFRAIARACRDAGAELVVAHGGLLDKSQAESIGADHVFDFVPQPAVLAQASLCVSHAGLNTVLDCLEAGVPMVVRPIAFDQKGATARILFHGIGERMAPLRDSRALARQIARFRSERSYRERLGFLSAEVSEAGGTVRAADLIDEVLTSG